MMNNLRSAVYLLYFCKPKISFPSLLPLLSQTVRHNSNRATVAKVGRKIHTRLYPTMMVLPDGSTINIRYKEPRKIITLPLDLNSLSEEERRARLVKRKPKMEVKVEEEIEDDFDASRYIQPRRQR
ncbi:hypothetical protein RvY_12663 [Ramazzottius varieornatus]|uniref:39S ribosomal protein L55, mitochondrial n=1 Tax=Ramazzottius varieornatus TaxID=947166 RepID=A0A1D1VKA4_RAMVA|nr:hypothetical protein RvY_12663 [Ramazzottius varieornatus]